FGGFIIFLNTSSADHGTFVIEGSNSHVGGALIFADDSTAANGSFAVNGGKRPGNISFQGGTAGDGVFVVNGGTEASTFGGTVLFSGGTAGNAILIANPGTTRGGGGGIIKYAFTSTRDESEARIELFGNGTLDVTYIGSTVGSIEGDGLVKL